MSEESERGAKRLELLANQCRVLMASFDTVQIFATKAEGGKTEHFHSGDGNYFARYGQIKLWTLLEEIEPGEDDE